MNATLQNNVKQIIEFENEKLQENKVLIFLFVEFLLSCFINLFA